MNFMKFQINRSVAKLFTRISLAIALCTPLIQVTGTFAADPVAKNAPTSDALTLKAENGPWLVLAKSFEGANAKTQAEQLAAELRKDFKLQAYCLSKRFDFTQFQSGAGFDENGRQRRMKFRDQKVVDGYAVLVGDFDSIDSVAATDTLAKIKHITPRSAMAEGAAPATPTDDSVSVSSYRQYLRNFIYNGKDAVKEPSKPGPMANAFITRNPLLPAEFYKAPELDKFVKKLNEQKGFSDYSLIDCPGKYTVRVVVFRGEDQTVSWGRTTGRTKEEEQISQLDVAAERAALTVRALRRAGYEAYQFHDRSQSYVTIGSFNELGKVDAANRFVYDKGIQDIVEKFGATKKITRSQQFGTTPTPRLLLELVDQSMIPELTQAKGKDIATWLAKFSVAFDLKPAPMAVPRMSVYSGSLLGSDRR
jgi:hypothetical protein